MERFDLNSFLLGVNAILTSIALYFLLDSHKAKTRRRLIEEDHDTFMRNQKEIAKQLRESFGANA